jgi:ethanolamine utilization protein EutA (predicted chaperonin)
MSLIKVCGDPNCEAIFHNVPTKETHCLDCDGRLIKINRSTYLKKYSSNYFQYDYLTQEYYYPFLAEQLILNF